jgi:hypothetical protein
MLSIIIFYLLPEKCKNLINDSKKDFAARKIALNMLKCLPQRKSTYKYYFVSA